MMAGLLERITGRKAKSAIQAKERLKLVLIHDRTDLTPDTMKHLQDDLLKVIRKYVEIDPSTVRISMAQDGREQRLIADIPVKSAKRRRAS
jgi:cell division topological specificity factor